MDRIVIWLAPVLGRCNSFSLNGLISASHQMKWNEFCIRYIYIKQWKTCDWCDIFFNFSGVFCYFFSLTKALTCCVGRCILFLLTVAILFVVSCVRVPGQDKGMALLWLGSFLPALHWGTSQQFWTWLSSLGVKETEHVCTAKANFPNLVNLTVPFLCRPQLL